MALTLFQSNTPQLVT